MKDVKYILKVLVGSQAHGLATPESDYDYRCVYLQPTKEILKINVEKPREDSEEQKEEKDISTWELGKFLFMATKCNPTVLECFMAPTVECTDIGKSLREQFPRVWNSKAVMDAFIGYGFNQRKKFLERKDNRPNKYATAYLRTLIQAYYLLVTGVFPVNFVNNEEFETLKSWRNGEYTMGEVINKCWYWENRVRTAYEHNPDKKTDFDQLNAWLLKVRKSHWD